MNPTPIIVYQSHAQMDADMFWSKHPGYVLIAMGLIFSLPLVLLVLQSIINKINRKQRTRNPFSWL